MKVNNDTIISKIPPVLVLSTGRCGSTMISEMLNLHPQILSLSEFFIPLGPEAFVRKYPTGKQMWRVFSRQSPALHSMLKDGNVVDEGLYPHKDPNSRFKAKDLPPIIITTLPHLTDKYEELYDDLKSFVESQQRMPLAEHYQKLFSYLTSRYNRKVWVERSGGSLMLAAKLLKLFPEARVVHVFRDGRDTAISMSKHHNFKVLLASIQKSRRLGIDPCRAFLDPNESFGNVWFHKLFFRFFNTNTIAANGPTLVDFGGFWSELIQTGNKVLQELPQDRLLNLKFEDVQHSPRQKLEELIRFIDPSLHDNTWLDKTSAVLRPTRSKFLNLSADEQAALTRACAPGLELLGYTK